MENGRVTVFQARDLFASRVAAGIAAACEDHAHGRLRPPACVRSVEALLDRRLQQIEQIAFEAREQHLRLGVAEAAVEFEHLDSVTRDHEAGEKHPAIVEPVRAQAGDEAIEHLGAHARFERGRQHFGCGRKRAHAASVQAEVAVECALVILRARKKQVAPSVHERVDAALLAFEKFLDHHLCARVPEFPLLHDFADRRLCFGVRLRDDHALAEREPAGLHDDWRTHLRGECARVVRIGKLPARRSRDAVAQHEFLREDLGRFQPRRTLRRPKNMQAFALKTIHDPRRKRIIRADDRQADAALLREFHKRIVIGDF